MFKTPCEYMNWQGLPIIRKELAKSMIINFGLSQKEVAARLGISPAAVCQYLLKKRGKISIINENILAEINISAKKIMTHGDLVVTEEICRICRLLQDYGIQSFSIID